MCTGELKKDHHRLFYNNHWLINFEINIAAFLTLSQILTLSDASAADRFFENMATTKSNYSFCHEVFDSIQFLYFHKFII